MSSKEGDEVATATTALDNDGTATTGEFDIFFFFDQRSIQTSTITSIIELVINTFSPKDNTDR